MSVCRKLPDGTIQKIAGHTILLDANAQEIRQGDFSVSATDPTLGDWHRCTITFTDPMPDNDYIVVITGNGSASEADVRTQWHVFNKTTTGFECSYWSQASTPISYHYYAWKPVKIEGYTELQNKVNNPDETPTEDSVNLCTSGGIYEAIKNASAVWKGTKSEWTALPVADKKSYDLAVLVDAKLIKAVDRTDGSDTDVADLGQIWKGTRTEWEALSLAERKTHGVAFFTDKRYAVSVDPTTGDESNLVDWTGVWKGSMEDWEALTDAEKAEWDVCITPTIAASDTNPFRTLSDPETLSIAPNTDYTCPHDGFIVALPATVGIASYYINGVNISMAGRDASAGSSDTFPVQKGDVFKYVMVSGSSVQVFARWYTNEVSPGEPDTPVLYRSQALDWDNAVEIPATDITSASGYVCPSDGYVCIAAIAAVDSSAMLVVVNGVTINYGTFNSGNYVDSNACQVPVSKGDVIKITGGSLRTDMYYSKFVPYLDYPDYSTTEHWTGKRWIDGKKIYSKTFTVGSGGIVSGTPITGFSDIIDVRVIVLNTAGNYHPCNSYGGGQSYYSYFNPTTGLPVVTANTVSGHVTVEYTKTTD